MAPNQGPEVRNPPLKALAAFSARTRRRLIGLERLKSGKVAPGAKSSLVARAFHVLTEAK
jgi:hypothetical protein